ncbi:hypothetical protein EV715DRAFT_255481, partial [Schizophyllum commune]
STALAWSITCMFVAEPRLARLAPVDVGHGISRYSTGDDVIQRFSDIPMFEVIQGFVQRTPFLVVLLHVPPAR